jgi:MFS transporter, VNT family, synaptic vesicle glycoprotein 2
LRPASQCSWFADFSADFCELRNVFHPLGASFNRFWHICSIAGSSATIYAYLGEFHSSTNRSKVLMAASFIYGVACNYMPILGFLVLNRTFHFHIPLFNIEFKPWRFYLLSCGLPSLVCALVLLFMPESPKFKFSKV